MGHPIKTIVRCYTIPTVFISVVILFGGIQGNRWEVFHWMWMNFVVLCATFIEWKTLGGEE